MPRWPTVTQETIAKIHSLRNQGRYYREISKEVGLDTKTVRDYLYPKVRERRRIKRREYRQKWRLTTIIDGRRRSIKVNKRVKPELCELCEELPSFYFHHWDVINLGLGMWLCRRCHRFSECLESGLEGKHIEKYYSLKDKIKLEVNSGELRPIRVNQETR